MSGVRIEGATTPAGAPYRGDALEGRTLVEIRNPPVLSAVGASVGACICGGVAFVLAVGDLTDTVTAFRLLAPLIAGLLLVSASLSKLRPHTRLVVAGDRVVIERGRGVIPTCPPLSQVLRFEADPNTGDVRAVLDGGPLLLVPEILPEQATEVVATLERARARPLR